MGRRRGNRKGKKVKRKTAGEGKSSDKGENVVQRLETEEASTSGIMIKKPKELQTKIEEPLTSERDINETSASELRTKEHKIHKIKTKEAVSSETEIEETNSSEPMSEEKKVSKTKADEFMTSGTVPEVIYISDTKIEKEEVVEIKIEEPEISTTQIKETNAPKPKIVESGVAETKREEPLASCTLAEEVCNSEREIRDSEIAETKTDEFATSKRDIVKTIALELMIETKKSEVTETKTEEDTEAEETYASKQKIKEAVLTETKSEEFATLQTELEETKPKISKMVETKIFKTVTEGHMESEIVTKEKYISKSKIEEAESAEVRKDEKLAPKTEIKKTYTSELKIENKELAETKREIPIESRKVTEETYFSKLKVEVAESAETRKEECVTTKTEIKETNTWEPTTDEAELTQTKTVKPIESGIVTAETYVSELKMKEAESAVTIKDENLTPQTEIKETNISEPTIEKSKTKTQEPLALDTRKINTSYPEANLAGLPEKKTEGPVTTEAETGDIKDLKIVSGPLERVHISEIETAPSLVICESINPKLIAKWPIPKLNVPTIFLHKPLKFDLFVMKFLKQEIKFYRPFRGKNFTKILCKTLNDYEAMVKYMRSREMWHHTFTVATDRVMRIVIRGLPNDTNLNKLRETLTSEFISILRIHKMKTKAFIKNHALLVLVVLPSYEEGLKLLSVQKIFGHEVTMEPPHEKSKQCHRCQKWGHAQRYCYGKVKCVKCGGDHSTSNCKRDLGRFGPRCANCRVAHFASYRKCTFCPDSIENKKCRTKMRKFNHRFDNERKEIVTFQNCHRLYRNVNYGPRLLEE